MSQFAPKRIFNLESLPACNLSPTTVNGQVIANGSVPISPPNTPTTANVRALVNMCVCSVRVGGKGGGEGWCVNVSIALCKHFLREWFRRLTSCASYLSTHLFLLASPFLSAYPLPSPLLSSFHRSMKIF